MHQPLVTRRSYYIDGVKIVHRIEPHALDHLPGKTVYYSSWRELEAILGEPITFDFPPQTPLTLEQEESHLRAARVAENTHRRAWDLIETYLRAGTPITELDVQEFILCEFAAQNCITEHNPICAVNEHTASPHHESTDRKIGPDDWILIDLWCRLDEPESIYADFTQMGGKATPKQQQVFNIVKEAQAAALDLIRSRSVQGFEVDQAARSVIEEAGYGEFFIHRTGHNITSELHGPGSNCDDYETHETRELIAGSCCSIEPGIYLPGEFGVRLECNVLLRASGEIVVSGT